ncbi:MAG: hypothetical protein J6Z31_04580 [Fibrobacter sp.]|nr:hypothetical protein [Fibrobacter sp.]
MTVAIIFTLIILLILFRAFVLHLRSTDLDNEKFAVLPREVKLAILKERVLETPSEKALRNLETFLKSEGVEVDMETYRPLYTEQLRLSHEKNPIALDNELYAKESAWMDKIEPFEFAEALKLKADGKKEESIQTYLQGVLRYYSDEKIESSLEAILLDYPAAQKMLDDYRALKTLRDESGADEASLEKLAKAKDDWAKELCI